MQNLTGFNSSSSSWAIRNFSPLSGILLLDVIGLSGIAVGKQKLGGTFNFDKQDVIDFTKISKLTMCRQAWPQKHEKLTLTKFKYEKLRQLKAALIVFPSKTMDLALRR